MALTQLQTQTYPQLQREIASHQVAASVMAILTVLAQAEQGNLPAQAELFHDMEERDAHIYAEMTKRRMALAQLDWHLAPARGAGARDKKAVQAFEDRVRETLDIETLVFDLASGIGHGFACTEIEWQRQPDGLWLPKALYPRPQRWFTVDWETRQQIRLRDLQSVNGVELQPYGWIVHRHSAKTGEPGTQGLYRVLALPYLFKNFATKNWLRFSELYGVPIRVLFSMETDAAKKQALLDSLQAIGQNGAAILTGGTAEDLQTVDAARGEGQGFEALINWCERSMSKAILGGTLTSQADGKTSTNALGRVHDDVRYQIRDHDAKQLAATLSQQLIGAILTVNQLNLSASWQFDTQDPEDLTLYADALPKLAAAGMRIPEAWARGKLKIPEPEGDEPILRSGQPSVQPGMGPQALAALAGKPAPFTPQQMAIEALAEAGLKAGAELIPPALIQSAIKAAKSPEDLEERLAVLAGEADPAEFRRLLERALFAADILGFAHADGR